MSDRLSKNQLAFPYGSLVPKKSASSISAQIITTVDPATQKITSVKFQVSFDVDMRYIKDYDTPNPDGKPGYQVNYNEVGFSPNIELIDDPNAAQLFVTFHGIEPMLNMSVPLKDPIKRDSESFLTE